MVVIVVVVEKLFIIVTKCNWYDDESDRDVVVILGLIPRLHICGTHLRIRSRYFSLLTWSSVIPHLPAVEKANKGQITALSSLVAVAMGSYNTLTKLIWLHTYLLLPSSQSKRSLEKSFLSRDSPVGVCTRLGYLAVHTLRCVALHYSTLHTPHSSPTQASIDQTHDLCATLLSDRTNEWFRADLRPTYEGWSTKCDADGLHRHRLMTPTTNALNDIADADENDIPAIFGTVAKIKWSS